MVKSQESDVSFVDAVTTLVAILEIDQDAFFFKKNQQQEKVPKTYQNVFTQKTVKELKERNWKKTALLVRKTFRSILQHLEYSFEIIKDRKHRNKILEKIRETLSLVTKSVDRLETLASFFRLTLNLRNSIEYKDLKNFFLKKVIRVMDSKEAEKIEKIVKEQWHKRINKRKQQEKGALDHVYVDVNALLKDKDYELFFLRKEDGKRFFHTNLIRNLLLVEGLQQSEKMQEDMLETLLWEDRIFRKRAENIIYFTRYHMDQFYRECLKYKYSEIVGLLNKAIMALFLSANMKNLVENASVKSCREYFSDFQTFLRQILHSKEYQKMLLYTKKSENILVHIILTLVQQFCFVLYMKGIQTFDISSKWISQIRGVQERKNKNHSKEKLWVYVEKYYGEMKKYFKNQIYTSLHRMVKMLHQKEGLYYDPLMQGNIPMFLFTLYVEKKVQYPHIRLPSPTYQEYIHRAKVIEEFKTFIASLKKEEKFLVINFQDRTFWKEYTRCHVLEETQQKSTYAEKLVVVTLPKDTEFYYQLPPYEKSNQVKVFFNHFKEQMLDDKKGFYFPPQLQEKLFPDFIDQLLHAIHKLFFGGKNVLTKESRLQFIEIFYQFLILKILDMTSPVGWSFTCKDGIDITNVADFGFYAFLSLLNEKKWTLEDKKWINGLLYGDALRLRERLVFAERLFRMTSCIKRIESVRSEYGARFEKMVEDTFAPFYESKILRSLIIFKAK